MSQQNHASKSGSLLGGCCGCGGPSSREIDRVRSRFGLKTDADIQPAGGTIVRLVAMARRPFSIFSNRGRARRAG
jgi:hypothetical protein